MQGEGHGTRVFISHYRFGFAGGLGSGRGGVYVSSTSPRGSHSVARVPAVAVARGTRRDLSECNVRLASPRIRPRPPPAGAAPASVASVRFAMPAAYRPPVLDVAGDAGPCDHTRRDGHDGDGWATAAVLAAALCSQSINASRAGAGLTPAADPDKAVELFDRQRREHSLVSRLGVASVGAAAKDAEGGEETYAVPFRGPSAPPVRGGTESTHDRLRSAVNGKRVCVAGAEDLMVLTAGATASGMLGQKAVPLARTARPSRCMTTFCGRPLLTVAGRSPDVAAR